MAYADRRSARGRARRDPEAHRGKSRRFAGVARCETRRDGGGWVGALGVRKPWRRRGVGRALLLHALRLVVDPGYPVNVLAVILGDGMIEALGNRGFRIAQLTGQRRRRYRCGGS